MPRIRIEPLGIEVNSLRGLTVMDAAEAAGLYWPAGCDRKGECTNCAMDVISGVGRLSQMGRYERLNLVRQRGLNSVEDPRLRLTCQAHVEGDVIVFKRGVYAD